MDKEKTQEIMQEISGCYRKTSGETDFKEKMEKVKELYATLPDPNAEHYGYPILFYAAEKGDYIGVEVLLKAGADAAYQTENKYTPLHRLAYEDERDYVPWADEKKVVELLLDAGTSAIRKDCDDVTCAYIAAGRGKFKFLQALAEAGKKMDLTCRNGRIPIHEACNYAKNAASSFFEYAKPKYDEFMAKPVPENEFDLRFHTSTKESLQNQYDRDKKRVDSFFESVKCLMNAGLDPDQKDDYGQTAKEIAFECKDIRISALLNGIYVEPADGENGNAGTDYGSDSDAELQMKTKGMTLMQATELRDYDAVEALLKLGTDPNVLCGAEKRYGGENMEGKVPLSMACSLLDPKLVSLLLQHGADPNLKDAEGKIPILYGLMSRSANHKTFENKGIEAILKEMMEKGLELNQPADELGNTLLNLSCYRADSAAGYNNDTVPGKFIQQLLKYKADVNIAGNDGMTPLLHICHSRGGGMEDFLISLAEAGADVSSKDKKGNTSLIYAAQCDKKSAAKNLAELLFEFGDPLPTAVNNDEKSALDYAVEKDNENLVNYLLSKM